MSSATSSLSIRLIATRFSTFLHHPKTQSFEPFLSRNPAFKRCSISFQRIPTKSSPSPPPSSNSLQPIEELPPKLQDIIKLFQSVPDPKSKYQQLLFYGKNLKPLDAQFKTRDNKVEGCVSQVWVRAYFDAERNVVFEADSDSVLTKGLAALLVQGLSGRPVDEIIRVSPDFVTLLGLQQSLTPSRNNGFLNMLRLMQKKALLLLSDTESKDLGSNPEVGANGLEIGEPKMDNLSKITEARSKNDESEVNGGVEIESNLGSRGQRIKEVLERELNPIELEVEDVSYQHAGHAGVRGSDGETHFNLRIVSEEFEGKSLVKRHRLVYGLLNEELQSGLHALSIVAKTPSEIA